MLSTVRLASIRTDSDWILSCQCCRQVFVLCFRCFHGQRYCGSDCSKERRTASLRRSGRRYQATTAGRLNHAARQQRYLMRRDALRRASSAKMTHQTTEPPAPPVKQGRPGGAMPASWPEPNDVQSIQNPTRDGSRSAVGAQRRTATQSFPFCCRRCGQISTGFFRRRRVADPRRRRKWPR